MARPTLPALALLLAAFPALAAGPLDRAREAEARGDLRAAQIELRNAVRNRPNDGALRAALAEASLNLGDGDTAEKEARAALERGHDPAASTALLLRSYLARSRFQELLREFPVEASAPPTVAGQVAAARAFAQLALRQPEDAKQSVAEALRLAPGAVEPHFAASTVATAAGDRDAAMAEIDKALAIDPRRAEVLLRKVALQLGANDRQGAIETLDRLVAAAPGNGTGRVLRAELRLQAGNLAGAREDVDAALRTNGSNAAAAFLRAVLLAQSQDWRGADELLSRLGPALANFPEGYFAQAQVKRQLGQLAQAEDAAQRHVARRPEDARGVKLLALLQLQDNRPVEAAGVLARFVERGANVDAETYDLLGRAQAAARRPREAAAAFAEAAKRAPENAEILSRLAAARLAVGDAEGTTEAAERAIALGATRPELRQMLGFAALARGDLAGVASALQQMPPASRDGEAANVLDGTVKMMNRDLAGARSAFEAALAANRDSISGRLGLVRIAAVEGQDAEVLRLLGEVVDRQPGNGQAISGLATLALGGGPQAAAAEARLTAAQAAAPQEIPLALGMAGLLIRKGEPAKAAALLEAEPLKAQRNPIVALVRAEAYAAANQWEQAEASSRTALAEDAGSAAARRQLAVVLNRRGDAGASERLLREGLARQPDNGILQDALVSLLLQTKGLDAALAEADRLAQRQDARPTSLLLRGNLLMASQRPEDAAKAFEAAYGQAPSALFALRAADAWQAAEKPTQAAAVLNSALEREPGNIAVLGRLAQFDLLAGRVAAAEKRLNEVVERAPNDAVSLNNLAWSMVEQAQGTVPARARELAERAYFLAPSAQTSDTLGWILARTGEAQKAVPLLRRSALTQRSGNQGPDPGMIYRYAFALRAVGEREEAIKVLEPALQANPSFPERALAERLLGELKAGR